MAEINVPVKRRLTDLYQAGKEVTIGDGDDENTVTVYIAKINDLDHKHAFEKSSAARAKHLVMLHDKNDPGRAFYAEQLTMFEATSADNLINLIIQPKMAEAELSIEARLAAEDQWTENNYLESLRESWSTKLEDVFLLDPEDEDASRVHKELMRFAQSVEDDLQAERKELVETYQGRPYAELLELAIDRLIDIDSSTAWVDAYNRWRVFYSVRDPDNHKERYFVSRDEVDELDQVVLNQLIDHYESIAVPVAEGKD